MSWMKKILKGSSHKISEGHHHQEKSDEDHDGICNKPKNLLERSSSIDRPSVRTCKRSTLIEIESNADEDEELARALQESLYTKSPSPENRESPRICAGCKDVVWHPGCFRCYACGQQIVEYDFSIYEDQPYHLSCYKNLYHPKCDVCMEFLPTKMNGDPDYLELPVWMQKFCTSHAHDGTPHCFSCHRRKSQGVNYSRMDDRSMICLECLDNAIKDIDECQPLYQEIREFYESLNMAFDHQEIKLHLVESQVLAARVQGEKEALICRPYEIAGLCRVERQIVQPKSKRREITILVLKGLPRILTGWTLAHEMMHAWLRFNGYGKLDLYVEEGICVVLSYMWVDSVIKSGSSSNIASSSSSSSSALYRKGLRSQFEKKFAEYCKCICERKPCPIYGDGFRAGYAAVLKYGLRSVLDHIKLTRSFPC